MKLNPLYRCALCGDITQDIGTVIDVPDSEVDKDVTWVNKFHSDNKMSGNFDMTYTVHKCKSGHIGFSHFAGFIPIETAGE